MAKFKVSDLSARATEIEMTHPTVGKTGIFVKLYGPHSTQFTKALAKYEAQDKKTDKESLAPFVAAIAGWDEEAFEMECNEENAFTFFMDPQNTWARLWLLDAVRDYASFFPSNS